MFHEVWNKMCLRAIINMQLYIMKLNKYSMYSKLFSPRKTFHETGGRRPIIWEVMGKIYRASSGIEKLFPTCYHSELPGYWELPIYITVF